MSNIMKRSFLLSLFVLGLLVGLPHQQTLEAKSKKSKKSKESKKQNHNPFRWTIGLNPNRDGSLMLNSGLSWQYFKGLNTGVSFTQLNRGNKAECKGENEVENTDCRDISVIHDRILNIRFLGYTLKLAKSFHLGVGFDGVYFTQTRKSNVVDLELDSYKVSDTRMLSYQLHSQLYMHWDIARKVSWNIKAGISVFDHSSESSKGYDSSLIIDRESKGNNPNNTRYTGNLGDFTENQSVKNRFMEIFTRLEWDDLIYSSDLVIDCLLRSTGYETDRVRQIIANGELAEQNLSQTFSKIDIYLTLAFEMSFINKDGFNPFVGLTYIYSKYGSDDYFTTDESLGIALLLKN
jgi:hypothetical protein